MAEKTKYGKESFKSPPKSVRFDLEKMEFAMRSEAITSPQRLVDFLLTDYWYRKNPNSGLAGLQQIPHILPSKREIIQDYIENKPRIQNLTKSNVAVEPPTQPTSNYAINSDDTEKEAIKQRIAELKAELKNPPKNPQVGIKIWRKLRETELAKLEAQSIDINQ